jgi:signal transduction histidine kinase
VSDTGIGIPAEALSRIFSPFEQGDSSIHPRYGGFGLGLSIARTLIKAHGGTLEVESEGSGQGAKFTARFKIDDSLSDLTIQGPLQLESNPPSGAKIAVAAFANSTNPEL